MIMKFIRLAQSNLAFSIMTFSVLLCYLVIYSPLKHRSDQLDLPLERAWQRLKKERQKSLSQDRLDLDHIMFGLKTLLNEGFDDDEFQNEKFENDEFENDEFEFDEDHDDGFEAESEFDDQRRIDEPFQLIDFQNNRQSLIEALKKKASSSVEISPKVFEAFPQHLSEEPNPHYLWAELSLTQHLFESMIEAKIISIKSLSTRRQNPSSNLPLSFFLEIDFQCESTQLSKMILILPHQNEVISNLKTGSETKFQNDDSLYEPSLFVDQIMIQKASTTQPDLVNVWMKLIGFIQTSSSKKGERQ